MKRWYQFLALCIALCLLAACGTSAQGKPQAEGGTGSNNSVDNGLLDGASPETSALSLYEWDGKALTVHTHLLRPFLHAAKPSADPLSVQDHNHQQEYENFKHFTPV